MTHLPFRLLPLGIVALSTLLTACHYFSLTPDIDLVDRVHREIPVGMTTDDAEIKLGAMDYACSPQHGAYTDERGTDHENARYLRCLPKPSRIGFACENRDQVLIVPTSVGTVASVDVIRGPDCRQ